MAFFGCNLDHMTAECVSYITFIINKWNDGLLGLITFPNWLVPHDSALLWLILL